MYVRSSIGWALLGMAWRMVAALVRVCWRFVTGALLDGQRRTDATFLARGAAPLARVRGWWSGEPGWWAYAAGWERAGIRWTVVILLWAIWSGRWWVLLLAAAAAGLALWRAWPTIQRRRHERAVVQPLFVAIAGKLGVDPGRARLDQWISVPADYATSRDAVVSMALPAHFEASPREKSAIDALIAARLGGEWDAHWRTAQYQVHWTRPPEPPSEVGYEPSRDPYTVNVARSTRNELIKVYLGSESPHGFVATSTGGGKTSTERLFIAHARRHGWLVDIIDPKRRSFVELENMAAHGVRVRTDIESMIEAFEEFYLSMDGVNAAVKARLMRPEDIPHRYLVIDEFSSFMAMARNYYRRKGGKGDLPIGLQLEYVALQGRQAQHRVLVAPHQPDAKVFGGTAVRNSFAFRLVLGAMTRTLWATAFGYQKQVGYNSRIPGRGLIALGEGVPREIQMAWLSEDDCAAIVASSAQAPDWFVAGKLPPWVTADILSQAGETAGVGWLSPWDTRLSWPAETAEDVPEDSPPADEVSEVVANVVELPKQASPPAEESSQVEPASAKPKLRVVRDDEEPLIVGLAGAAAFLGMKTDTFKRARSRWRVQTGAPIPGETQTEDGRPAWRARDLRSWQSKRKIAGGRPATGTDGADVT